MDSSPKARASLQESAVNVQPENQAAWADACKDLISKAKSDTNELFAALEDSTIKHIVSPKRFIAVRRNPGNKRELDECCAVTKAAVNVVDVAILRVSNAVHKLQHERQKKWAGLKVCEWRISLRQRRPPQELFNDHLQDALEAEVKALEGSRTSIADFIAQGKTILEDCEANKARLIQNVRYMVNYGTAKVPDHPHPRKPNTLKGTTAKTLDIPDVENTEELPSQADDALQEQSRSSILDTVPVSQDELLKRATSLQQEVLSFCQKSEAEIQKQRDVCTRANERVLARFQKRWTENEAMKKNLEQQIAEMENAIASAEKSLVRMKKRIDHYGEVDIQPKYDNAAAILQKLRSSKFELEEDFHRKLVSLKIDECCRKITPERCTGQKPEDMPCTAILEITQKKHMKKTASSPAFTGNAAEVTMRPGSPLGQSSSPLGQSSPLKSAARVSINSNAGQ